MFLRVGAFIKINMVDDSCIAPVWTIQLYITNNIGDFAV